MWLSFPPNDLIFTYLSAWSSQLLKKEGFPPKIACLLVKRLSQIPLLRVNLQLFLGIITNTSTSYRKQMKITQSHTNFSVLDLALRSTPFQERTHSSESPMNIYSLFSNSATTKCNMFSKKNCFTIFCI